MIDPIINFFIGQKRAYMRVFDTSNESAEVVLKDLAKFCRAGESTFHADDRIHALLEGRREVFQRIMDHTKMNQDDFVEKYKIKIQRSLKEG